MYAPIHPYSGLHVRHKRARLRIAVPYFLAHREERLSILGLKPDSTCADVRAAIRASRSRLLNGHWTFEWNRHIGLQQAYVALRYEARNARRAERRAA